MKRALFNGLAEITSTQVQVLFVCNAKTRTQAPSSTWMCVLTRKIVSVSSNTTHTHTHTHTRYTHTNTSVILPEFAGREFFIAFVSTNKRSISKWLLLTKLRTLPPLRLTP
eukprot:Gregarina_sp_Pseudo_9__1659@NODE_2117_length_1141_cov_234_955535_g1953_i0_p2_GENE_NODE_2117_length_1141_cov_234_955535_g1953_i0NODE_2117_length_1141_cov_234_955535_g1953_i0_p2_ORF_typecomplete_len111_score22_00_NODE_2117_length_1141_cov_234_955535_g1953_i0176508